jgi:hypothetical protein
MMVEREGKCFPVLLHGPGGEFQLCVSLSFSAVLPVEVAFRRGLSFVSPQRTVQLKTKIGACVIMNPDLQNYKNAASEPAGRVLVGNWACLAGAGVGVGGGFA